MKRILSFMLMFLMVMSITVFAGSGTLTISASKTSGQVGVGEEITYTCTTDSKDTGVHTFNAKITDASSGKELNNYSATTKNSLGVAKYNMTIDMPSIPYDNIKVAITFKDTLGKTATKTYSYTMDTKQVFDVVASPASGNLEVGSRIELTSTAKLTGVGIKKIGYIMYDGSDAKIASNTITPKASEEAVGFAKYIWTINGPTKAYSKVRLVVNLEDVRGNTYSEVFQYTMNVPTTALTLSLHDSANDSKISNGATLEGNQKVYVKTTSSNSSIGVKSTNVKIYKTSTNSLVFNQTGTSKQSVGANPLNYSLYLPTASGDYKLVATSTDINGKASNTLTVNFKINGSDDGDDDDNDKTGNEIDITASYPSGSKLKKETVVKFESHTTNPYAGTKTLVIDAYNNKTNALVKTFTTTSKQTSGANPFSYNITFSTLGEFKIVVKATDILGNTKSETFIYEITNGETEIVEDAEITIKFSPSSGKEVEAGDDIEVTATTSNSSDKVVKISYKMYDEDDQKIASDSETSTSGKTSLSIDAEVPDDLDDGDEITLEVTAKLESGKTKTSKAKYTIGEDDDEDDDSVINSEGDDLAVDLWLVDNERFYELDEEIDFIAYYYNFESKTKKDVVLEIEIPEGFTIKSVTPDRGTVKKKNGDYIKVTIGNVPSEELEKVSFTLVAEDDDLSEDIAEIVATISSEDDEEDMSTQRVYIYEKGEDGSYKAFITGYTDGTFRPDNNITREEAAAMIARAFGHTATYSSRKFTDVKQTSWSYKYIAGCTNKGIITGYTDGSFKPYNNITRAELYAMIYRSMNLSLDNEKALLVPKEYKRDSSWETGYIAGLARLRMLKEMDETDADEYATRAEVVYLISRVQFRNPSRVYSNFYSDVYSSYWCAKDIAAASVDYTFERKSGGKEDMD